MIASNHKGEAEASPFTPFGFRDKYALYNTKHCGPAYVNNNQGTDSFDRWSPLIRSCTKVLEVGCGNGKLCEFLSKQGKEATGVDLVAGPYTRSGYEFKTCDFAEDSLPRGFDAVVSFDVLEHLEPNSVPSALANIDACADVCVLQIAGWGNPPLHLTVKSPGWWLNMILNHMRWRTWTFQTWHRYESHSPIYLFQGACHE